MTDSSFLQAALDLLGRPGNMVRGGLIAGPQGAMQGLSGSRLFDPTELPGVNSLPDEGPSLGPLHVTPRTVAGFGASAALDPLSYVGGLGLGHVGQAAEGVGALGRGLGEELTARSLGAMPSAIEHSGFRVPSADSILGDLAAEAPKNVAAAGYPGDARADPIEHLLAHANGTDPATERAAISNLTLTKGKSLEDLDPRTGDPMYAQSPPSAEPTPVGNQRYAQGLDKIGQTRSQLQELDGQRGDVERWLSLTAKDTLPANDDETWQDVIRVRRGTPADQVTPDMQEAGDASQLAGRGYRYETEDPSVGPGLGPQRLALKDGGPEETVAGSRQQVLDHLTSLQNQMDVLRSKLEGTNPKSRYGDPLDQRGMENSLSDWAARQNLKGTPELSQARSDLERTSTSRMPGLSPKQDQLAYKRAGAPQESMAESMRRDNFSRMPGNNNSSSPGPVDTGGVRVGDQVGSSAESHGRAGTNGDFEDEANPGDPLNARRSQLETQAKFGNRGAGTYSLDDDLGVDANRRSAGGVMRRPEAQRHDYGLSGVDSADPESYRGQLQIPASDRVPENNPGSAAPGDRVLGRYESHRVSEPTADDSVARTRDDTQTQSLANMDILRELLQLRAAQAAPHSAALQPGVGDFLSYLMNQRSRSLEPVLPQHPPAGRP